MSPVVILAIAFLCGIAYYLWKRAHTYSDIVVPDSGIRRTDLLYGYYSCLDAQVAETKDHINLLHESQFNGPEKCIQNILDAATTTILDVSYQVFDKGLVRSDAETRLFEFFHLLETREALKFVKIIYPTDEPNNTTTIGELVKGVDLIKRIAANFRDLNGVKLAVIYAADKKFIGQEMFDYVGFDDYDKKSSVLTGQYQKLVNSLLPFQQTILVPGGAYGQDPVPFTNWAQTDMRVGILMPFLWFDDKNGSVGAPGIRSNSTKAWYIAAGKSVCNA